MKCADDGDPNLPLETSISAERTALLCKISEETYKNSSKEFDPPVYVIGTDVPPPGGMKNKHSIRITPVNEVEATIELTKKAFEKYNLQDAWERVVAVVVQPGVEFGDSNVFEYQRSKAIDLIKKIEKTDNLIYEAHSTDYQRKEILKQMVADHFAILKVGPWLTYAFREAVFALAFIEKELLSNNRSRNLSNLLEIIDYVMVEYQIYWEKYYFGSDEEIKFARKYSYSDRIRYYWSDEAIINALLKLIKNLTVNKIPDTLLSQFMPDEYQAFRDGEILNSPEDLIHHKILKVLEIYNYATTE
jgi:D-tagatose-1,6-bisphosphate aldolase subunit GatZ/KbaZ